MNAKIAEIKSKLYTALSNVRSSKAAYKHAIETGLEEEVFKVMTARSLDLLEISINSSHFREGLANSSGPDLLQFIPIAEEYADKVLKESERALEILQGVVTAANERERAREEKGKTKENEDCEEPANKKAKKDEAKEGESSNKPGGSYA